MSNMTLFSLTTVSTVVMRTWHFDSLLTTYEVPDDCSKYSSSLSISGLEIDADP
ncbi:MAG: hypothetical protein R8M38_09745 [Mariprofundaceae bacterium]